MPIIKSLLDTDFYKFSMLLFIWKRYREVPVKFALTNRSTAKYPLTELIDETELREQLEHIRSLRFSESEIEHIASFRGINKSFESDEFKDFLRNLHLPDFLLEKNGSTYRIESKGAWPETTLWETFTLSVVAQLVGKTLNRQYFASEMDDWNEGDTRLTSKIEKLKRYPDIKFVEFGTRRRYSRLWQRHVLDRLLDELTDQLLGTSNVLLAKELGIKSLGTMAHELMMAFSGIYRQSSEDIRFSHMRLFDEWWDEYGEQLSVALNETYGSDSFFEDFGAERARLWKGYRPDSGDPIVEGEKIIVFLKKHGIDPKTKSIFFADGQDPDSMIKCHLHFRDKVNDLYGPGTNITNDVGLPTLSLVMKLVEANGHETVKLSNNIAKATGSSENIERFKNIFGHTSTFNEECRY